MSSKNKYLIPLAVFAALFGTLWCRALDVPIHPKVKSILPIVLEKRNEIIAKPQGLSTETSANKNWMAKLPKTIWSPSVLFTAFPDIMAMITAAIKTGQRPAYRYSNCTTTDSNNFEQKSVQPKEAISEAISEGLHKSKRVISKCVRIGRVPRQLENMRNTNKTLKTTDGSETEQLSEEQRLDQTPGKLQAVSTGNKLVRRSGKRLDYMRKRFSNAKIGKLPAVLFLLTGSHKRIQSRTQDLRKVSKGTLPRYG